LWLGCASNKIIVCLLLLGSLIVSHSQHQNQCRDHCSWTFQGRLRHRAVHHRADGHVRRPVGCALPDDEIAPALSCHLLHGCPHVRLLSPLPACLRRSVQSTAGIGPDVSVETQRTAASASLSWCPNAASFFVAVTISTDVFPCLAPSRRSLAAVVMTAESVFRTMTAVKHRQLADWGSI